MDSVIAMEAVFLPSVRTELRNRFAMNGSVFLAVDPQQRREKYQELLRLYDVRSRLVHGGASIARDELVAVSSASLIAAREALLRALRDGWPADADYLTALLS